MFTELFYKHRMFARSTFKSEPPTGKKLESEVRELKDELAKDPIDKTLALKELADCQLCIMSLADALNFSPSQLMKAVDEKIEVNKARTWKQNEDGSYSHVKTTNHE